MKSPLGIVLAGGSATRMPNKPLLVMKDGRPVICSSIDFLHRSGIDTVCIVVPPFSPITHVIPRFIAKPVYFVIQPEPTGVPHAIKIAVQNNDDLSGDDELVVTWCDNIFGPNMVLHKQDIRGALPIPHVSVKRCPPWQAIHLGKQMVSGNGRIYWSQQGNSDVCIAGWYHINVKDAMRAHEGQSSIDFLNEIQAAPFRIKDDCGWWDVGTPDMYAAYWGSND